ncbi:MAG: lamin tail domain-containing protein [Phycisphaerae bacterium]|nr:lamin tail domain-containing protein [Phycisphaerae bacterium]
MSMRRQCRRGSGLSAVVCMVVLWLAQPGFGLMITEVMYHPPGQSAATEDEKLEFIELYNNRAMTEDLSGWAFTKGVDDIFEPNTVLGPKQYLVVARDPNALKAAYNITNVVGPYTGKLDNNGERVELSNANGGIVFSFKYASTHPWPISPDGAGHSLVLAKLGSDPEEASSWAASAAIGGSPGGPEPAQAAATPATSTTMTLLGIGSPGRYFKGVKEPSPSATGQPTTAWTQVGFNDDPATTSWLDGPSGYGYSNDAGELQWVGTQLNDMNGKYISIYARLRFALTAEQIASFTQLQAEVHYDDGYVLYLNGTRVAASGEISGTPPAYNASGGPAAEPAPVTVDLTQRKNLLAAGTNVLAVQVHNATLSGSSDGFIGVVLQAVATKTSSTGSDPTTRLVINELLPGNGSVPGWIELYNPGPTTVDLSRVYLSNDRFNLLAYKIPDGTVLPPGGFWVVQEGTPPVGLPFTLGLSGGTVYVTAVSNTAQPAPARVLDAVRYDGLDPGVAFGRYPDGSPALDSLASATFAKPNAPRLIRDIVINEIMYHHATQDDRFQYVELYNRGTSTVSLNGWAFTSGINYTFGPGAIMPPGAFLVVARDPNTLAATYGNLILGANLVGPFTGTLSHHSDRIRLSFPLAQTNPKTGKAESYPVVADEVTYYDGGRWPKWADGMGASLELRDPRSDNDTPDAWADSDESGKTHWQQFSYTIDGGNNQYIHDSVTVFDLMLLGDGEVLLDDLELIIGGTNCLVNNGFENGKTSWRTLGNHTRSFVSTEDHHSGSQSLHVIATGHGDPGANRINQSIPSINAGTVTFRGWARWLRGSRYLLLRTTRERSPIMPPRPAYAFELEMPLDLGTPGRPNTAFVTNRGPDILEVQHAPILPAANQPIIVTARVLDHDGVQSVTLYYRSEGTTTFSTTPMTDDGTGSDKIPGDGIYTAAIPGVAAGTMRAFYLMASDGTASTRFPTKLEPSAAAPERTCLVRVGDGAASTRVNTYRVWMSNDVVKAFQSRPNLSNELMDCTFVYNDADVFYNCGLRLHGSPFLRSGANWNPYDNHAFRIEFNPDQKYRGRAGINLDNTEGSSRGPLQERASYWFFAHVGLQYSTQEWVRLISNGHSWGSYDDVRKIDGDYIDLWFATDNNGYLHKVDDYFEYSVDGTGYTNIDEGLRADAQHPLIPETYRWHFEKRSHSEEDNWQHLFDFAIAMNTSSGDPRYEQNIEAKIEPRRFAKMLATRHAVGDWDSYGYTRGKNSSFYYALPEGKWHFLAWDIDFTLGSGRGSGGSLFEVGGQFPEVTTFLNYPKYKQMYYDAFTELVNGPWKTSYGTSDPPTAFDRFLDEGAAVLVAEGWGDGRRNAIKQFVRDRRTYILSQFPVAPVTRTPQR